MCACVCVMSVKVYLFVHGISHYFLLAKQSMHRCGVSKSNKIPQYGIPQCVGCMLDGFKKKMNFFSLERLTHSIASNHPTFSKIMPFNFSRLAFEIDLLLFSKISRCFHQCICTLLSK